jgi:hypothetical protein
MEIRFFESATCRKKIFLLEFKSDNLLLKRGETYSGIGTLVVREGLYSH